jgi:hypothetical protein
MLVRLRGRIRGRVLDSEDLDQLVLLTFIDAVRMFPLDRRQDRGCLRLRQSTQRRLSQVVRRESAIRAMTSPHSVEEIDPEKLPPWPSPSSRSRRSSDTEPVRVDDSKAVALLAKTNQECLPDGK